MREASTELMVALEASSNVTDLLLDSYRHNPSQAVYARRDASGWRNIIAGHLLDQVQPWPKASLPAAWPPGTQSPSSLPPATNGRWWTSPSGSPAA
ncbi:hypothetical protein ACHMXB_02375 [Arthrobacter sp. UC242_113]|uniref:hypothetical protein n=1 Tax=Arthrobacter sp. UC242_113 TaxID=3374550 RepID=UPI003757C2B5